MQQAKILGLKIVVDIEVEFQSRLSWTRT